MSKRWPLLLIAPVASSALVACASRAPSARTLSTPRSPAPAIPAAPAAPTELAPTACSAAAPITLALTANRSTALAATSARGALWILDLGAPDPRGVAVASLLEVRGASTDAPSVADTTRIGEADVDAGVALAAWRGGVVGAFGAPDAVTVFRLDASGNVKTTSLPAAPSTPNVSIAVIGERALTVWDDGEDDVEYAWVDLASMQPSEMVRLEDYGQPAVAPSFGGLIALTQSAPRPGGVRGLVRGDAAPIELAALGSDDGSGAAIAGTATRAFVVYDTPAPARPGALVPTGTTKLATLTDARGAGVVVELGASGPVSERTIALAPWGGAIAAYGNDEDGVDVAAVTAEGGAIGRAITASPPGEPAGSLAIAGDEGGASVVWHQPESLELRMARVACR